MVITTSVPELAGTPVEVFTRILDLSGALLEGGKPSFEDVPDDEIHRDILFPLLPAMLKDRAIRESWRGQVATGFFARLKAHVQQGAAAPKWEARDFEIHVTASYLAGPDAKALADTLLSESFLREITAGLMNGLLERVWPRLPVRESGREVEPHAEITEELAEELAEVVSGGGTEEKSWSGTTDVLARVIPAVRRGDVRRLIARARRSWVGHAGKMSRNPIAGSRKWRFDKAAPLAGMKHSRTISPGFAWDETNPFKLRGGTGRESK